MWQLQYTFKLLQMNPSLWTADVSPRSSQLSDVSRGGMSATQRQKFHTDDTIQSEALIIDWWSSFIVLATVYE